MSFNRRFLILFLLLIALPGAAFFIFGLRTLSQEKIAADQELRDQLFLAIQNSEEDLKREYERWMDSLHDLPPWPQIELSRLPKPLQQALGNSEGSMLLRLAGKDVAAIPLNGIFSFLAPPPLRESAKTIPDELQARKIYKTGTELRREGKYSEALAVYARLGRLSQEWLGGVPAGLIADFESCSLLREAHQMEPLGKHALSFYTDLVQGRWSVEKSRYQFYAYSGREWLRDAGLNEKLEEVARREKSKLARTKVAEEVATLIRDSGFSPNGVQKILQTEVGSWLVFLSQRSAQEPVIGLILSPATLADQFWRPVFAKNASQRWLVRLTSSDGVPLFASDPLAKPVQPAAVQSIKLVGDTWTMHVWPRRPVQLYAKFQRRQRVYISMLVLFAVSLAFALYFSARTLFRQFEIARMKADFVSTVTHEFRTPLTGIRHVADMLAAERVPGEQKRSQYYSMILQETDRLTRMIENVLAFSRIAEKRGVARMETIDPNRWLKEGVSIPAVGRWK